MEVIDHYGIWKWQPGRRLEASTILSPNYLIYLVMIHTRRKWTDDIKCHEQDFGLQVLWDTVQWLGPPWDMPPAEDLCLGRTTG